uniref:Uncharacterized protein n=1 Tax=Anguilla anguilla TaxID=7936 RepID=A0A0E9XV64_ANGAN
MQGTKLKKRNLCRNSSYDSERVNSADACGFESRFPWPVPCEKIVYLKYTILYFRTFEV